MKSKTGNVGGKPPKPDKAAHPVMVRFTDEEYARFLALYEQSGVYAKAVFIKARVFGAEFRVLKVDKTLVDYYTKLSSLHAQYRAVGVNYNQTVKELKSRFSEKKAMALLYKLEKMTVELADLSRQILALTHEFQQQWLSKLA
nr:conjugal transfer protein MobA [Alistipes onderdonkii]